MSDSVQHKPHCFVKALDKSTLPHAAQLQHEMATDITHKHQLHKHQDEFWSEHLSETHIIDPTTSYKKIVCLNLGCLQSILGKQEGGV